MSPLSLKRCLSALELTRPPSPPLFFFFFWDMWSHALEGLLSTGPTLSSFMCHPIFSQIGVVWCGVAVARQCNPQFLLAFEHFEIYMRFFGPFACAKKLYIKVCPLKKINIWNVWVCCGVVWYCVVWFGGVCNGVFWLG